MSVTRPGEVKNDQQSGSVSANVQVNVINNSNGEARTEERQGANGQRIIDVIVDRARSAVAQDISQGGSDVNRAMEARYALNGAGNLQT